MTTILRSRSEACSQSLEPGRNHQIRSKRVAQSSSNAIATVIDHCEGPPIRIDIQMERILVYGAKYNRSGLYFARVREIPLFLLYQKEQDLKDRSRDENDRGSILSRNFVPRLQPNASNFPYRLLLHRGPVKKCGKKGNLPEELRRHSRSLAVRLSSTYFFSEKHPESQTLSEESISGFTYQTLRIGNSSSYDSAFRLSSEI